MGRSVTLAFAADAQDHIRVAQSGHGICDYKEYVWVGGSGRFEGKSVRIRSRRGREIASIQYDMNDLGEISDAPKWDPRNRARAIWRNLRDVKDIGQAIQTLAEFGNPKAL